VTVDTDVGEASVDRTERREEDLEDLGESWRGGGRSSQGGPGQTPAAHAAIPA